MAKVILFDYTFDASAQTITLDGIYDERRFLLITNVTSNDIIFSFSKKGGGFSNVVKDHTAQTTTLTLDFNTTSMADTDELQIFVEQDAGRINFDETYTDPVSKLRVSQPENMIDTDFEYGLQSTKWETLELVKNIPTFFSRNGDTDLPLIDVTATSNSNVITVTTDQDHGLGTGNPILVQGTNSVTADGAFVVTNVLSTTQFEYIAKADQSVAGSIYNTYTQVFVASIYQGTEFQLKNIGAITTDGATPSTLTVETESHVHFKKGTSFFLSNSVGSKEMTFDAADVLSDNKKYVNVTTPSHNTSQAAGNGAGFESDKWSYGLIDMHNWEPTEAVFFDPDIAAEVTVNTTPDTFTFPNPHGFSDGELVVYLHGYGNNNIGSLTDTRPYYVKRVDDYEFGLATSQGGSNIALSVASSDSYQNARHCIARAYRPQSVNTSNETMTFSHVWSSANAGQVYRGPAGITDNDTQAFCAFYTTFCGMSYYTNSASAFHTDVASSGRIFFPRRVTNDGKTLQFSSSVGGGAYNLSSTTRNGAMIKVRYSPTRNTIFFPDGHGCTERDMIRYTVSSGSTIGGMSNNSYYTCTVVDEKRLRFWNYNSTSSEINFSSWGSYNGATRIWGDVYVDGDYIVKTNHGLRNGDVVSYSDEGGTTIPGLVDGNTYYVNEATDDQFRLSSNATYYSEEEVISNNTTRFRTDMLVRANDNNHPYQTGDRVQYFSDTPVGGLKNGAIYYVRRYSASYFYLFWSEAGAIANTGYTTGGKVYFGYPRTGTSTFKKVEAENLTGAGVGTQKLTASSAGSTDGVFSVSNVIAGNEFEMQATTTIPDRIVSFNDTKVWIEQDAIYVPSHYFVTGDLATLGTDGTVPAPLVSGTGYYIIRKSKDWIQLADTEQNAVDGVQLDLTSKGSGAHTLTTDSVTGQVLGAGTVDVNTTDGVVVGEGTNFASFFNKGDTITFYQAPAYNTFNQSSVNTSSDTIDSSGNHNLTTEDMIYINPDDGTPPGGTVAGDFYYVSVLDANTFRLHPTAADASADTNRVDITSTGTSVSYIVPTDVGATYESEVNFVNGSGQLTLTTAGPADLSGADYAVGTSLLIRADGFALHRPYDGGVELIPSKNPDSNMIRQTRKYFRYQSGKGIQVSFAINFSPTVQIDNFTAIDKTSQTDPIFYLYVGDTINLTLTGTYKAQGQLLDTDDTTVLDDSSADDILNYEFTAAGTYHYSSNDGASANTGGATIVVTEGPLDLTGNITMSATAGHNTQGTFIFADGYTDRQNVHSYRGIITTRFPHRLGQGLTIVTSGAEISGGTNYWNDTFTVDKVVDDFTIHVEMDGLPADNAVGPSGLPVYYVNGWNNSALRCGLFDDQNGLFFEYDGSNLYVVRRSSTRQLSGYAAVAFKQGQITGVGTKWTRQISAGENIVVKGQTYLVTEVESDTSIYVLPSYRGVDQTNVIISKVEDEKVVQSNWNLDKCDGNGKTGFNLDLNKIQMAYIDYSWYGAGKVRFGFKDQKGVVKYVHEFVHGNFKEEAYMRSGNMPARYQIENVGQPTYVPALAHWGTSVIMDGRFDDDRAYIFTATSNDISVTGTSTVTVSAIPRTRDRYYYYVYGGWRSLGYALEITSPKSLYNSISDNQVVTGTYINNTTRTNIPTYWYGLPAQPYQTAITTRYGNANSSSTEAPRNLLLIDRQLTNNNNSTYNYTVTLGGIARPVQYDIPLISIRLAPAVDTNTPGNLGEREIVNRMQLILNSVGIQSTHNAQIVLRLNGAITNNGWERVTNPSLSQLIYHTPLDEITGGVDIFTFRAQGGTGTSNREAVVTTQELAGGVVTLGNSIQGGDGVYPDGPDVLTIVARLTEDPSTVSSSNPFVINGRASWSESQA